MERQSPGRRVRDIGFTLNFKYRQIGRCFCSLLDQGLEENPSHLVLIMQIPSNTGGGLRTLIIKFRLGGGGFIYSRERDEVHLFYCVRFQTRNLLVLRF